MICVVREASKCAPFKVRAIQSARLKQTTTKVARALSSVAAKVREGTRKTGLSTRPLGSGPEPSNSRARPTCHVLPATAVRR